MAKSFINSLFNQKIDFLLTVRVLSGELFSSQFLAIF